MMKKIIDDNDVQKNYKDIDSKEKAIERIQEYLAKHLLLLIRLARKRDNEPLLFKFMFLDALKEQIEAADESQVYKLAVAAYATMEAITEDVGE